jgi:hypothetical protein
MAWRKTCQFFFDSEKAYFTKLTIVDKVWSQLIGTDESQFVIGFSKFHTFTSLHEKTLASRNTFLLLANSNDKFQKADYRFKFLDLD